MDSHDSQPPTVGDATRILPRSPDFLPRSRNKVTVAVLIAARGGSKGIPGKNLADLGGLPLIAHSILAARKATLVDRVFVSTDSPEIAHVATSFGAEVPVLRPDALARDDSNVYLAHLHLLYHLKQNEGFTPTVKITLQPTSPFRSPADIDQAVRMVLAGCWTVSTFMQLDDCYENYFLEPGEMGSPWERLRFPVRLRRQYAASGYLSALRYMPILDPLHISPTELTRLTTQYERRLGNLGIFPAHTGYVLVDWVKGLDLDHPADLELARYLVRTGKAHQALERCGKYLYFSAH